jgi:hypothetical protein
MRSAVVLTSVALLLSAACGEKPSTDSAASHADTITVAVVDLTLGGGDDGFAEVGSAIIDSAGRIIITDFKRAAVHVFAPDGRPLFDIGRRGSGPGEFERPYKLAFDREGKLWLSDSQNERFNRYELSATDAKFLRQVSFKGPGPCCATLAFDAANNVVDIGLSTRKVEKGFPPTAWVHRDSTGKVVRLVDLPAAPAGLDEGLAVSVGDVTLYFYPAYSPSWLSAYSPTGDWVAGLSSKYEITWYDEDGKIVGTIARDEPGEALSAADRDWAHDQNLRQLIGDKRVDTAKIKLPVPDVLPPLSELFFDQLGQLWVKRTVHRGSPNIADVYNRDGKLVERVTWPEGISLSSGYITRDVALGVMAADTLDGPRVVRLRLNRKN